MKTSILWIFAVGLLPIIGNCEVVVLTQTSTVQAINIPAGAKVVDMSGNASQRSEDAKDFLREHVSLQPSKYPAVVDTTSGAVICDTNDVAQMMARMDAASYRANVASAAANLDKNAPLLDAFPLASDIPTQGLLFRIKDETDASIILFFVVRPGDFIATQLSAHDAQGNAIISSVDLRTGVQTIISTASLPKTTKKAKQKGKL